MNISKSQPSILWVQVFILAALQGSITLAWLVYNTYIPQLLVGFGFPIGLAVTLLIVENALGVVMEPLMGGLSDQTKRFLGSRFPFISAGVILSSALFIAIPCIVTFVQPTVVIRPLLPIVLVVWALAMTVFRSPAIALLGKYSRPEQLPLAASIVTLAGGIIGAFRPIANKFILSLGPIFSFAIASFVMLVVAAVLRLVNPPEPLVDKHNAEVTPFPWQELSLILGTGFGVAWGSRLLMDILGKVLKAQLNTDNIDVMMVGIGLAIAFANLPAGLFAVKIGNRQAILLGIVATLASILLTVYLGVQIPILLILITGFSLIMNGTIPFALSLVPKRWQGLGVGIYFGGFSLAMSFFTAVFPQSQAITSVVGTVGCILAFLLTGVCVVASGSFVKQKDAEI